MTAATKLQTCSQEDYNKFFCLCCGHMPENSELPRSMASASDLDPVICKRKVDMMQVRHVLDFNAHGREGLESGIPSNTDIIGLWLKGSLMNHSCCPNVQRTFVGDMMVCRAAKPLKAGTEL